MKRPEQILHKAVVSHLNARAYPDAFWFHPANGGKRTAFEARLFKALGVIAGVPDLIFLKAGRMYALELKAAKGRPTASQNAVLDRMTDCGASVSIAHSLDEALVTLEYWQILKRGVGTMTSAASSTVTTGDQRAENGGCACTSIDRSHCREPDCTFTTGDNRT